MKLLFVLALALCGTIATGQALTGPLPPPPTDTIRTTGTVTILPGDVLSSEKASGDSLVVTVWHDASARYVCRISKDAFDALTDERASYCKIKLIFTDGIYRIISRTKCR